MDGRVAARSLAALGHEGRLQAFRLLAEAGPEGLPAGEVARRTGALQNTSSSNLSVLASSGLIAPRRAGRSIFYAVSHEHLAELLAYLVRDCSGVRPDVWAPFFASLVEAFRAGGAPGDAVPDRPEASCG